MKQEHIQLQAKIEKTREELNLLAIKYKFNFQHKEMLQTSHDLEQLILQFLQIRMNLSLD
ncbi:Spo0E family sporulation regulatory protein-aspartic acid phosphatase [Paenibacillus sp. GP183]|jgi:hypothetical protein|uniref:Spo0E family sporulation regulatory protein-aspartic acid phosphatase n=1 Tax=Paenibacillus sp. GP183 TaxID=1882751 RepID=UPI00089A42C5|nr:Spo0E family sporulation regulatory protein-aspartic acid phosphatase [Paenibacillus sp. GP183]SED08408.1 Spo0E like sporulation regulatory protein [Paenibacillus sp. GP183]